jgi:DNA-binding MarR family transcriptional regulator
VSTSTTRWTFLTNHAHVLLCVAADPDLRLRDIALKVNITERAVQRIITDLATDGYVRINKEGRRNHYSVIKELQLRHPVEQGACVADLVALIEATKIP